MDELVSQFLERFGGENKADNGILDTIKGYKGSDASGIEKATDLGGQIGGGLLDAAPDALMAISSMKGDGLDTSATGGGPGRAGGHIIQSTMSAGATGRKIGKMFGPKGEAIGQAAGLITGLVGGITSHKKAMNEWRENQKEHNLKVDDLASRELADQFLIENGLASMENLKSLRKKQLGMLET